MAAASESDYCLREAWFSTSGAASWEAYAEATEAIVEAGVRSSTANDPVGGNKVDITTIQKESTMVLENLVDSTGVVCLPDTPEIGFDESESYVLEEQAFASSLIEQACIAVIGFLSPPSSVVQEVIRKQVSSAI